MANVLALVIISDFDDCTVVMNEKVLVSRK
jgi:hypothetical protein